MSCLKTWAQHPRTSNVTAAEKGDGGGGRGGPKGKKNNKTKQQHLRHQLRFISFVQRVRPTADLITAAASRLDVRPVQSCLFLMKCDVLHIISGTLASTVPGVTTGGPLARCPAVV